MKVLIAATTAAASSAPFTLTPGQNAYVFAQGLAGVETVTLQRHGPAGFSDMYSEGQVVQLTATENTLLLEAPGTYRVVKSTTAGSASVSI